MVEDNRGGSSLPPEIRQDNAFTEKYLIESTLGIGGSGIVVCARHRGLEGRVAIKFLLSGAQNKSAVARFRQEAHAAHRIKSQHVVRINDIETTDSGIPYIVMECLEGHDLEWMLQSEPDHRLSIPDAIEFVLQACEGVAAGHALGIVHRDLKPSNLFYTRGADGLPLIKVLDFGISKLEATPAFGETTDQGRILGSPRYMSPEQFDSAADVDEQTDVWAFGVILYQLLAGKVPFDNANLFRLREQIQSAAPRPLREQRPEVPVGLAEVISRCLEKSAKRRYRNLAEMAKALGPFAARRSRLWVEQIVRILEAPGCATDSLPILPGDHGITSDAPTMSAAPSTHRPAWRRRRALGVIAAVVAIGFTSLFVGWRWLGRRPGSESAAASAAFDQVGPMVPPLPTASLTAQPAAQPAQAISQFAQEDEPLVGGVSKRVDAGVKLSSQIRPAVGNAQGKASKARGLPGAAFRDRGAAGNERALVDERRSSVAANPDSTAEGGTPTVALTATSIATPAGAEGAPASSASEPETAATGQPSRWITNIVEKRKAGQGRSGP